MSVDQLIAHVEKSLPKWRAWFPSEASHVEITRGELLELIGEIKRLQKRCKELDALLDHTADGKVVDECEKLYCPKCASPVRVVCGVAYCDGCDEPDEHGNWPVPYFLSQCYSTSEAAEASPEKP